MTVNALRVSVVIPHYGDPEPTRSLVAQLVPQIADVGGEIVVADDASPIPLSGVDGAVVVRRSANGGFGAAVNTAVETASGELLLILNSDLSVSERFVAELLEAAWPWLPAVVAPRVITDGHPGATTFRFPSPFSLAAQRIALLAVRRTTRWGSWLIGEDRPADASDERAVDWVSGAAMLVPAPSFRAVGGFDERFHMYMEEVDLQRRLREHGVLSVYVGGVVVRHAGSGSSEPSRRDDWQLDSWLAYAQKYGWRRRLVALLESALLMTLVTDTVRRLAGRDVRPWRHWREARTTLVAAERRRASRPR